MRLLALIGAVALTAGLLWQSTDLVVADEDGVALWRRPAAEGSVVVLRYTNSLYLAPVYERFDVRAGRLALIEVASTSEAALEYNRHPGPYRRSGAWVIASVQGVTLNVLALRVGERGRPTLEVDGATLPLYQAGTGAGLRISVRREARLLGWSAVAVRP